jgi:hypothetical protein
MGCQQNPRRLVDPILRRGFVQHVAKAAFRGGDAGRKIRCRANGITQQRGFFTQDITSRDAFIDQSCHIDPGQSVEARWLKKDVKQMQFAGHVKLGATRVLRPNDDRLRGCLQKTVFSAEAKGIGQVNIDNLMGSRR